MSLTSISYLEQTSAAIQHHLLVADRLGQHVLLHRATLLLHVITSAFPCFFFFGCDKKRKTKMKSKRALGSLTRTSTVGVKTTLHFFVNSITPPSHLTVCIYHNLTLIYKQFTTRNTILRWGFPTTTTASFVRSGGLRRYSAIQHSTGKNEEQEFISPDFEGCPLPTPPEVLRTYTREEVAQHNTEDGNKYFSL